MFFLKGLISDKFGKINCFYYSGICFVIGLVFTVLVSFGSLIRGNKAENPNETNETTVKSNDESELNKNLLSKA